MNEKDTINFKKVEHVIPQSFGKYSNNFTLKNLVCDECNQYFGNTLELPLARDTYEGLSRYLLKIDMFNGKEIKTLGKKSKFIYRLDESKYKGLLFSFKRSEKDNTVIAYPLPQIGFKVKKSNEYLFYNLDKIPTKEDLKNLGVEFDELDAIIIFGCSDREAINILKEKNISFRKEGYTKLDIPTEFKAYFERAIDNEIVRVYSKIAFNYLAYILSNKTSLFSSSFDDIRKYIRYGINPSYKIFKITYKSLLIDEKDNSKHRLGHIVTLEKNHNNSVVSNVSLMNDGRYYTICLSRDIGNIEIIKIGHFFNLAEKNILPLCPIENHL